MSIGGPKALALVATVVRDAARAAAAFLRGFFGVMPSPGAAGACPRARDASPAAARAALTERAARRPSCC